MATMIVPGEEVGYQKCLKACKAVNQVMNKTGMGTVIRGIHSEGPIISQLGALKDPLDLLSLDRKAFGEMIDSMGPHVKIMTISPYQENNFHDNCARIKVLLERGIVPALGHDTQCTQEDILGCLKVGSTKKENPYNIRFHITHAFNVTKFHHREAGLANFALVSKFPNEECFEGL